MPVVGAFAVKWYPFVAILFLVSGFIFLTVKNPELELFTTVTGAFSFAGVPAGVALMVVGIDFAWPRTNPVHSEFSVYVALAGVVLTAVCVRGFRKARQGVRPDLKRLIQLRTNGA